MPRGEPIAKPAEWGDPLGRFLVCCPRPHLGTGRGGLMATAPTCRLAYLLPLVILAGCRAESDAAADRVLGNPRHVLQELRVVGARAPRRARQFAVPGPDPDYVEGRAQPLLPLRPTGGIRKPRVDHRMHGQLRPLGRAALVH